MAEKYPMTRQGFERLRQELEALKNVERPAVVQAIAEARAHGDLSENAEYHAAREKQGFIEARIKDLEAKISFADVIDIDQLSGKTVTFGATVKVEDEDNGQQHTYHIVGSEEADVARGAISITAPLARALLNKTVGDSVEVNTPSGSKGYEILDVSFRSTA